MSITLSRCSMPSRSSCAPGLLPRSDADSMRQPRVEDVGDERALARARDAGDRRRTCPAGSRTVTFCRLFSRAPTTRSAPCRCPVRRVRRHRDLRAAGEILPGDRLRPVRDVVDRARRRRPGRRAAPAPGSDVDDPVGRAHRLLVVLDDDQGVADVAQSPSVRISRALSRWCSPMLGSSRM